MSAEERMDRLDARLDTLIDVVAELARDLIALTVRVDTLTTTVDKLAELVDRHFRHDHGYGSDDDE